ncbi:MAG: AraC family transcriptional regulator [Gammaproteobacteria bacterium]|jgi:AraC-like DNA-binding protein
MDPLSDFLPAMRVQAAAYTRVEATAPWGVDFDAYHHAKFGIILQGECLISVEDATQSIALSPGSCYLLPRGNPFTLRDCHDTPLVNFEELLPLLDGRLLRFGGGGQLMTMLGGRFIFAEGRTPPLLNILPTLVHFKVSDTELPAMKATMQLLAAEAQAPGLGSRRMIDRIAEIFFLQTLRAYINADCNHNVAWLGAVADPHIAAALRTLHEHPEQAWNVESLAKRVGMSRSVFAQRFKAVIGEAPMEYLARCRIHKATRLLQESNMSIGQIGNVIGYESDGSFNKAFKRRLGISPGRYRSQAVSDAGLEG